MKNFPKLETIERHQAISKSLFGRKEIQITFVLRDKITGDIYFRRTWIPFEMRVDSWIKK